MSLMNIISAAAIPVIIAAAGALFLFSKKELFAEFLEGARGGLKTAASLIPTLAALLVCISMFRASGALGILTSMVAPITSFFGIPKEATAFVLMSPLSGSGSTAMLSELFREVGPDSPAGRVASVIMGCTDTVLYIFAVYFGAVGVRRTRYALPAALLAYFFCVVFSCFVVREMFG